MRKLFWEYISFYEVGEGRYKSMLGGRKKLIYNLKFFIGNFIK